MVASDGGGDFFECPAVPEAMLANQVRSTLHVYNQGTMTAADVLALLDGLNCRERDKGLLWFKPAGVKEYSVRAQHEEMGIDRALERDGGGKQRAGPKEYGQQAVKDGGAARPERESVEHQPAMIGDCRAGRGQTCQAQEYGIDEGHGRDQGMRIALFALDSRFDGSGVLRCGFGVGLHPAGVLLGWDIAVYPAGERNLVSGQPLFGYSGNLVGRK